MAGETTTVTLAEPIQFGTERIDALTFRRPKAKDFRAFPMDPKFGDILDLAGKLAAQPKAVMDELGVEDLGKVMDLVGSFVPGGHATGQTP